MEPKLVRYVSDGTKMQDVTIFSDLSQFRSVPLPGFDLFTSKATYL